MPFPLSTLFEVASTTTIVLDGLDEVEEGAPELEQLLDFLKTTSEQTSVRVKTLLFSRDTASLQHLLSSLPSFLVGADDTMLGKLQFVRARTNLLKHLDPCSELIQEVVAEKSKGLFLWVEYFMGGFEGLRNINEIYDYLENTKDGLSSTYQDILQKLETGKPSLTELRKKILAITASSFKPLTLPELEEAIAIRTSICRIDDLDRVLGGWDTIHAACGSFLQFTEGRVELLHLSATEFILSPTERIKFKSLPRDGEEAHEYMAAICLTYLLFHDLRSSLTGNPSEDRERLLKYPLLEYASLHWADHFINSGNISSTVIDLLKSFVTSLSGITWAVSYFPYFKLQDGESIVSAFGLLQTQISQVKIGLRKSLSHVSTNLQRTTLLKNLDKFLIRSFEKAVSLETHENGANHRDTMERQLDLSKAYQASRDLERAYETASKAYRLASDTLGTANALSFRCQHQQLQVAMELELWKDLHFITFAYHSNH